MKGEYLYKIGDIVKVRDDIDRNMYYYMRSGPKAGCEPGTVYHIGKYMEIIFQSVRPAGISQ